MTRVLFVIVLICTVGDFVGIAVSTYAPSRVLCGVSLLFFGSYYRSFSKEAS